MSQDTAAPPAEETPPPARRRRRFRVSHKVGLGGLAVFAALLVVVSLGVRLGVTTDTGRLMIERMLDGRKVGRLGHLRLQGLGGDIFGDFTARRVAIVDAKGAWVEARQVKVVWRPLELLARRVHAQAVTADVVSLIRQPELLPDDGKPPGRSQVSVRLDKLTTRLETLPAFSRSRGNWNLAASARVARSGDSQGKVEAKSLIHAGDGLSLDFRFGPKGRMFLRARADEGAGGALAGSLGLDASQRVTVRADVDGTETAGTLSVTTQSGAMQPLTANGRWFKGGASLDARVALGASRLADDYTGRLGPEVSVKLRTQQIRGDLHQVDLVLAARDGRLSFLGPIDWRKRSTDGGSFDLSVADLSKWATAVHAGPAHMNGKLSASEAGWRFVGSADGQKLDQLGYQLARASGPLELTRANGELRIKSTLVGSGGAGDSLVAGMMGATPRATAEVTRYRDGRILIRSLDVQGAGVTIKAEGDRTLLGGLNMKGTATATDLAIIRPGARGSVGGVLTLSEARNTPWKVDFDAKGAGFASGIGELDRLLGPEPSLKGGLTWQGGDWTFNQIAIVGQALQIDARGTMDDSSALAIDADWKAAGPFAAGPLQVVGEVAGRGRMSGPRAEPRFDTEAELVSLDIGRLVVKPAKLTLGYDMRGSEGRFALAGPSNYGAAKAEAGFRFTDRGLAVNDLVADAGGVKATGSLALSDGAPSTADIALSVGPGAFLAAGKLQGTVKVVDQAGGPQTKLSLVGTDLAAPDMPGVLKSIRLTADGPWARLPFTLASDGLDPVPWRFAGAGVAIQAADRREISLTGGGRVRRAEIRFTEPALFRMTPDGLSLKSSLSVAGGTAVVDARKTGELVDAKLAVHQVDLAPFAQEYVGRLNADLSLNGRGATLGGSLDTSIEGGRSRDAPADVALTARVKAVLQGDRLTLDAGATNPQGLTSSLNLVVPAEASARPFRVALVRNKPLAGKFAADGEMRPLWDLFAGASRSLAGRVTMQGTVGGTLNDPRLVGQAALAKGRFQDAGTGLVLQDIALDTRFDGATIEIAHAEGTDGKGGVVGASGRMDLAPNGASSLTLDLKKFQLIQNEIARATASGRVIAAKGADGKTTLTGQLAIDRADVNPKAPLPTGVVAMDVVEINKPERDEPEAPPRLAGPIIGLDVQIAAARGIFVKGNGLNLELSLDAKVGGTTAAPVLSGVARVSRGDYDFAGKRFEFDNRGTIRLASRADQVRLNLTATREDPTLTAVVSIQGTAARPIISLTSNPILPQDEVLAQVLFGRSAAQLSSIETAQLAAAVAALATGGGFDVLGGLRQFARLDRLALAGGGAEGTAVSGGKYITDNIYLELTGGGRYGPSAQVELRVKRNFAVVSTVGGQDVAKLSLQFRKNY